MENPFTEFKNETENPEIFQEIMKYNCAGDISYEEWEEKRKFIAEAINDDGTILDIGCAGGFLLKSLQAWSGRELTPYGIDINEAYIAEAKKLFPRDADHFEVLNLKNISELSTHGLPDAYDFVYASVFDTDTEKNVEYIKINLLPLAKKRLVIGLYAPNNFTFDTSEWENEREDLKEKLDKFMRSELQISGSAFNPTKFNQAVAWIDIK